MPDNNITLEEAHTYIKKEIHKEIDNHRSEHDVFYQAVEEVLLSISPLYLSD